MATIQMKVECISDFCENCEQLELQVDRMILHYDNDGLNVNHIKCKNYPTCTHLVKFLNENREADIHAIGEN